MGFDGFASLAGFDQYFGRMEYDNEKHADQAWGILDEYFNPWTAKQISRLKQPFAAALFTLSSHHPYYIPPHMRSKVKYGPQPICASLSYGDIALRYFFEEAQKQDWYKNTLFVITADHTPASTTELYSQRTHATHVPIAFFHGGGLIRPEKSTKIFQHVDILPTILDLLNVSETYYSCGRSYFQHADGEAFYYLSGSYHYFRDDFMLTFTGDQARNLYNFKTDQMPQVDSFANYQEWVRASERRLKAIIQRYNRDLILNQTRSYEKENSVHH
jgi:phosphoglycerol transferase MdoB-like AlkP superfamily enzyme